MSTAILMAGCLLLPNQSKTPAEANLAPRLTSGQELVYRGMYSEERPASGLPNRRNFRIEIRVFVLETSAKTANLAILTQLLPAELPKKGTEEAVDKSIHLELVHLNNQGKISSEGGRIFPLKGPPSLESGMFIQTVRGQAEAGATWEIAEANRPPLIWKLVGSDNAGSLPCWKMAGVQQTDDWEKPRADRSAWKRTDTVWLIPRLGVAQKVERLIEHREPGRQTATEKYSLTYELESCLNYPRELSQDRQREITLVHQVSRAIIAIQDKPATSMRQLATLQARIANHLESQPPTPYRDAVLQLKSRVESAQRGELPPEPNVSKSEKPLSIAKPGQRAPGFITTNYGGGGPVALKDWLGKPILMVFYSPGSRTAVELLNFAQETQVAHREDLSVLGLSMSEDAEAVLKQQAELRLTIPLLHGGGLRQSFSVDSTPKLMLLDGKGIVRAVYDGWGGETGTAILADLKNMPGSRK